MDNITKLINGKGLEKFFQDLGEDLNAKLLLYDFPREHYEYGHDGREVKTCSCIMDRVIGSVQNSMKKDGAKAVLRNIYFSDNGVYSSMAASTLGYSQIRVRIHGFLSRWHINLFRI